jgi:hypothetical protein
MTGVHGQAGAIKLELVQLVYIRVNLTIPLGNISPSVLSNISPSVLMSDRAHQQE